MPLDKDLHELLKELGKYSDDDLNYSPGDGKWSVLQIMNHLKLSEQLAHRYIVKKLSFSPELKKSGHGFLVQKHHAEWFHCGYRSKPKLQPLFPERLCPNGLRFGK